jgi:hypothetical protein
MLTLRTIKPILFVGFFSLFACKSLNLIPNYHIFKNLYLFDLRHVIVLIYMLIAIKEYRKTKQND